MVDLWRQMSRKKIQMSRKNLSLGVDVVCDAKAVIRSTQVGVGIQLLIGIFVQFLGFLKILIIRNDNQNYI
jgi:hypothetical protein